MPPVEETKQALLADVPQENRAALDAKICLAQHSREKVVIDGARARAADESPHQKIAAWWSAAIAFATDVAHQIIDDAIELGAPSDDQIAAFAAADFTHFLRSAAASYFNSLAAPQPYHRRMLQNMQSEPLPLASRFILRTRSRRHDLTQRRVNTDERTDATQERTEPGALELLSVARRAALEAMPTTPSYLSAVESLRNAWLALNVPDFNRRVELLREAGENDRSQNATGWLLGLISSTEDYVRAVYPHREKHQKFGILDSPTLLERDFAALDDHQATLLYADIDNFKALNTRFTERVVDATILPAFQRTVTTFVGRHGYVYSEGGDEIVVLLPEVVELVGVAFAEALRAAIAATQYRVEDETVSLTISIGVAHRRAIEPVKPIAERANRGKAAAKKSGKNCTCHEHHVVTLTSQNDK